MTRQVRTSLEEDLKLLGANGQYLIGGISGNLQESTNPLKSPKVNNEMFDAIMGLPLDEMEVEEIESILEILKNKNEDDPMLENESEELRTRAIEVVNALVEAVAKKKRRARAGSMAKKASFQCPPGTRSDPKDPTGRRCVRAAKAAGGAGKLAKERRKKARWTKSGKGKISSRKSERWAARRGEDVSPFAYELYGLMEDDSDNENKTVRDDILEKVGNIFELLSECFDDETVTMVYEDAYDAVLSSYELGRLDEDVMDDDDFMAEIKPMLNIIYKSLEKMSGDSGN